MLTPLPPSPASTLSMADRCTDRRTDNATSARQTRTANPIAPSTEPTAMKSVPSGISDFCRYGAPTDGGTVITGNADDEEEEDGSAVVSVVSELIAVAVLGASVVCAAPVLSIGAAAAAGSASVSMSLSAQIDIICEWGEEGNCTVRFLSR